MSGWKHSLTHHTLFRSAHRPIHLPRVPTSCPHTSCARKNTSSYAAPQKVKPTMLRTLASSSARAMRPAAGAQLRAQAAAPARGLATAAGALPAMRLAGLGA